MSRTLVFVLISAAAFGCKFDPAGAPMDDSAGGADAAGSDDDPTPDASILPIDARPPIDAAPPPPIDAPSLSAPGGDCTCDADCAGEPGHPGMCVYGVCMQRASGMCEFGGSTGECPDGSRCWFVDGASVGPVCWPDCSAHTCTGDCDGDDSCVPAPLDDCDASCGAVCGS